MLKRSVVGLGLFAGLILGVCGCTPHYDSVSSENVHLVISNELAESDVVLQALFVGELVKQDPSGCVIGSDSQNDYGLVFPVGVTVMENEQGIVMSDGSTHQFGDDISVGGGASAEDPDPESLYRSLGLDCVVDELFFVNHEQ